jgi:hypothetical protein
MKPEKMTTEALVGIRQRMESGETMTAGEQRAVLAFIAALEAEQTTLDEHYRTACADASRFEGMCRSAESDLSAIRQRAGDESGLLAAWYASTGSRFSISQKVASVARYILGEDGAGAETPAPYCDEHGASNGECATSHPEPTTAEAFATQRLWLNALPPQSRAEAEANLSLLERRMGAMARELGLVASDLYHERFATAESRVKDLIALTDAPPVFTLEEVETVVRGALTDSGEWAPVVGIVMSAIRERLHALRR